jgi:DNA-binding HxlR family transcriptional regulator
LSQKVVSQVLERLERDGLATRTVFATVPVTVEYAITPLGTTLAALTALSAWAEANIETVLAAQARYDAKMRGTAPRCAAAGMRAAQPRGLP